MRICVLLLISVLLFAAKAFAQTTISGIIIDSLTKEPLGAASVFLANESKSTSSLSDGTFKINAVAPGKHIVIISYIGYQKYARTVLIEVSSPATITAPLQPAAQSLHDVTVGKPLSAKNKASLVAKLENALFGNSENASKCKILNPAVLNIRFNKKKNILTASCDSFLLVRNNALGYNINILLDEFEYDYNTGTRSYLGKVYFSEISASNAEHKRWERKRAETYLGSIRHFLKSAISETWKQEGFVVHPIISELDTSALRDALIANKVKQFESGNPDSLKYWQNLQQFSIKHYIVNNKFLSEKELVKESDKPGLYELKFGKNIYVISSRKRVLAANGTYQLANSVLTLNTPKTIFDVNGVLLSPGHLISQGENTETIADLLPFDYTLSKKDEMLFLAGNNPDSIVKSNINHEYVEKVYLRTNRNLYHSGDTVWLSSYLVNARNNQLSDHSSILYTELIGSDYTLLSRRMLKLQSGIAAGDFFLDDTLPTGVYRIRAYTNWMRNYGHDLVFEKEIEVIGKTQTAISTAGKKGLIKAEELNATVTSKYSKPLIHFYPESGSLVTDVFSRVAFTATDSIGTPLKVKGKIVNAAGDSICTAETNTDGMGDFLIKPRPGLSYYFVAHDAQAALSQVLSEGFSLFVQEKESTFNILISTNAVSLKKDSGKKFRLLIKHAGINIAALTIPIKLLQHTIKVPKKVLFPGVNVVLLEDADNKPLAERLIFCETQQKPNISLQKEFPVNNTEKKVNVSIAVTDSSGLPVKGHMSVSVFPRELHHAHTNHIVSYLMLSSEIKGGIYNPSIYFDENNPERKNQLDLLLLTQGWRDYLWKYHNTPTSVQTNYKAEVAFKLQGSIVKINGGPATNVPVSLYVPGAQKQKLYTTQTDTAGLYNFTVDDVYGKQSYTISAMDSKGQALGEVQARLITTDTLNLLPDSTIKEYNYANTRKLPLLARNQARLPTETIANTVQKLKAVKVVSRANTQLLEGNFTTFGYREENFEITPADYSYNNLKHYLLARSGYATQDRSSNIYACNGEHEQSVPVCRHEPIISKRPGKCSCGFDLVQTITEATDRVMFAGDDSLITPQLFVNGRQLNIRGTNSYTENNAIYQQYLNLSMKEVGLVKIRKVLINNTGVNKTGYLLYIDLKQGLPAKEAKFNGAFEGYYQAKIFYTPGTQELPTALVHKTKELYWAPDILTGLKDSHLFTFFTRGYKGEYLIIVEGLTDSAVPFYKIFECNIP
ncbi:carboxypeptidase regulatory-like domain-containing protein [Mucilaginibacter terrae]